MKLYLGSRFLSDNAYHVHFDEEIIAKVVRERRVQAQDSLVVIHGQFNDSIDYSTSCRSSA